MKRDSRAPAVRMAILLMGAALPYLNETQPFQDRCYFAGLQFSLNVYVVDFNGDDLQCHSEASCHNPGNRAVLQAVHIEIGVRYYRFRSVASIQKRADDLDMSRAASVNWESTCADSTFKIAPILGPLAVSAWRPCWAAKLECFVLGCGKWLLVIMQQSHYLIH